MPALPPHNRLSLALRYAVSCMAMLGLPASLALAAEAGDEDASFEFNELFLNNRGGGADLRYFERGSVVAPGRYAVDVYLNLARVKRHEVMFSPDADGRVAPVITRGLLRDIGVNLERLEAEGLIATGTDDASVDLGGIPAARADFNVNKLALMISVPQSYVPRRTAGYVDPSLWDDGVTAFFTNYQANFNRNRRDGSDSDYGYLSLRSGLNVRGWRLRNDSVLSRASGQSNSFRSQRTWLEHDIRRWNAKLSLGDLYTSGEILDSVRFRGVQVATDLGMWPTERQGYAPVVRGIAETNATVEIRQNGSLIYSIPVPAGAFEINDLPSSGSNGDLHVRILEADGRVREFTQSFATLPVMARPGSLRYSLSAGEYRGTSTDEVSPTLVQGSLVYGIRNNLTAFGGALAAEDYQAINLGVGTNSRIGGISLDVTQSRSKSATGPTHQGQNVRLLYAKTLTDTGTTLTMAGYRYSTEGYRSFSEHLDDQRRNDDAIARRHQKSRVDLNVNQLLPRNGSLYLSLGETSYWNLPGRTRTWRFGYAGSVGQLSYNLAVSRDRDPVAGREDTQVNASFSVPLGGSSRSPRLHASATSSRNGADQVQASLSGYLDRNNTASYSVQANHDEGHGSSSGASLLWDTPMARLGTRYQQGGGTRHFDASASGSLVVHRGGMTLGQPVGETFGLLEVPKARGVGVVGWNGVRTNRRGYAVVPYLQPYRMNWLNVDTEKLGGDIEVLGESPRLVPTRGAVVKARYGAEVGRRVQFVVRQANGTPVPFGAMAYGDQDKVLGMVDNQSRVLVFGVPEQARVELRWGDDARCVAAYVLPKKDNTLTYDRVELTCQPMR